MVTLEYSDVFHRKIRQDTWDVLGQSTWILAQEEIRAGRIEKGLELFESARWETNILRHTECRLIHSLVEFIAQNWGEEQVERLWRSAGAGIAQRLSSDSLEGSADQVLRDAEIQRGHHCGPRGLGDLSIVEETDRFVLTMDPCGSGGFWRRTGEFGKTKKAYPWSWGKAGVPHYCIHCCVWWEMMAIEGRGYPVRIHENVDQPQSPCVHLVYKNPELIPEHYFTRLGMKKDKSKFKYSSAKK